MPENTETSAITPPPPAELNRRTVLQGAAWTIPVIAAASVAPAATASASTLLLKFDKTGYTGSGCSTVTGASVKATDATSGAGVAGIAVVVTLPNGYTFDGGTTTYSGTTAASGVLALPGIHLPASGTSQTITALATTGEMTSSTLEVTSVAYSTAAAHGSTGTPAAKAYTLGTLPAGTTMLDAFWALSPTGNLYYVYGNSTKLVDTNVSSAATWVDQNTYNAVTYLIGTTAYSTAAAHGSTGTPAAKANTLGTLPAGTTMLDAFWALSPTGNLYYVYGNSTKLVDTNVSSAATWVDQNNYNAVTYLIGTTAYSTAAAHGSTGTPAAKAYTLGTLPAGTTMLDAFWALSPTGNLYYVYGNSTKLVDTNVSSAATWVDQNTYNAVTYLIGTTAYSTAAAHGSTGTPAAKANTLGTLPAGTTMLDAFWALSPTGNLYYVYGNSTKLVDTNVSSAATWVDQNNYNAVTYLIGTTAYSTAAAHGSTGTPAAKAYTLGTLPAGTTMLDAFWALSPTGNLYYVYGNSTKLVDTNVSSAATWVDQNTYNAVTYLLQPSC